jgi:hypothetical protein
VHLPLWAFILWQTVMSSRRNNKKIRKMRYCSYQHGFSNTHWHGALQVCSPLLRKFSTFPLLVMWLRSLSIPPVYKHWLPAERETLLYIHCHCSWGSVTHHDASCSPGAARPGKGTFLLVECRGVSQLEVFVWGAGIVKDALWEISLRYRGLYTFMRPIPSFLKNRKSK